MNIENYNQLRYQFQTHQLPQINAKQSFQQEKMSSTQERQVNQTNLHFGQPPQDMHDSSYKFYQKNVYSSRYNNGLAKYSHKRTQSIPHTKPIDT